MTKIIIADFIKRMLKQLMQFILNILRFDLNVTFNTINNV